MKYGARNKIEGTVETIKKGTIMCSVKIKVGGPSEVSSVMTLDSLEELDLKEGDKVRAVVKAIHVLLVKD